MKISDILLSNIKPLWDEAADKNFVIQMAEGTLDINSFKKYMIQDPNMEKLGIKVVDIQKSVQNEVFKEYVSYMKSCAEEYGMIAGLISLLQCSWCYAYIAKKVCEKYSKEIANSSYKDWFEAYTCKAYIDANQTWIDVADRECMNIDKSGIDKMIEIFKECAVYENKIWDSLL